MGGGGELTGDFLAGLMMGMIFGALVAGLGLALIMAQENMKKQQDTAAGESKERAIAMAHDAVDAALNLIEPAIDKRADHLPIVERTGYILEQNLANDRARIDQRNQAFPILSQDQTILEDDRKLIERYDRLLKAVVTIREAIRKRLDEEFAEQRQKAINVEAARHREVMLRQDLRAEADKYTREIERQREQWVHETLRDLNGQQAKTVEVIEAMHQEIQRNPTDREKFSAALALLTDVYDLQRQSISRFILRDAQGRPILDDEGNPVLDHETAQRHHQAMGRLLEKHLRF